MALPTFNWVPDDLFKEAKEIRSAILDGSTKIDEVDNMSKNLLLEYYRAAHKYASLELEIIEKRLSKMPGSAAATQLELLKAGIKGKMQKVDEEINSWLRMSGISLLNDFPVDPHPLPPLLMRKI